MLAILSSYNFIYSQCIKSLNKPSHVTWNLIPFECCNDCLNGDRNLIRFLKVLI